MIDFDTGDDAARNEIIGDGLAVVGVVVSSFIEEDDAREIIFDTWGAKKDVAVIVAMNEIVGNAKGFEFLMDGAAGFVGGENAFCWRHKSSGNEFERFWRARGDDFHFFEI